MGRISSRSVLRGWSVGHDETMKVTLTKPVSAGLFRPVGTGTIVDDD